MIGTQPRPAVVAHNGLEPATHRSRIPHLADATQRDQHRVLNGVLRVRPEPEQAQGDRPHPGLVPAQQHPERTRITRLGSPDQLRVIHRPDAIRGIGVQGESVG
ncbi:hypothetical protein Ahu01nite_052920 [Winogradskya humida]|uniref:Uncharacterized protein n=1 Tax=Winogradskya humida TaxID=113566 RepID=A0ABQ3ZUB5_9ACTN|nr:hypothetical protein [Actinoplanes humidus]GIE22190.1 hypothetical protein Ahu01nite_052920 [Actinoplanes humidus]